MKISKAELKQIIKEEVEIGLHENMVSKILSKGKKLLSSPFKKAYKAILDSNPEIGKMIQDIMDDLPPEAMNGELKEQTGDGSPGAELAITLPIPAHFLLMHILRHPSFPQLYETVNNMIRLPNLYADGTFPAGVAALALGVGITAFVAGLAIQYITDKM